MECKIIDGKKISGDIKDELRQRVTVLSEKGVIPCLAVVLVGNDPASHIYVRDKKRACEYVGIKSITHELDESTSMDKVIELIDELNNDKEVHGILVQLPLPKHLDANEIQIRVKPEKDVDVLSPYNAGLLSIGSPYFKPCTPAGIIELLKRSGVTMEGKKAAVLGRSNIVGKPVASLLMYENATVTICHSKTEDISEITKAADIVVAAVGMPGFLTGDMIKEGAAVIDVGINRTPGSKKICGDVHYESCAAKAGYITPVPGGVGPMTIAMLMQNCVEACEKVVVSC